MQVKKVKTNKKFKMENKQKMFKNVFKKFNIATFSVTIRNANNGTF